MDYKRAMDSKKQLIKEQPDNLYQIPYVTIQLNGVTVQAIVDTCSTHCLITKELASTLALTHTSCNKIVGKTIKGPVYVEKNFIADLKIGEKTFLQRIQIVDATWTVIAHVYRNKLH